MGKLRNSLQILSIAVFFGVAGYDMKSGRVSLGAPPEPKNAATPAPPAKEAGKITVYCSVDEEVAKGVLDRYRARTGADLQVIYDTEAGKTTGLINKILEESESGRPRCDVLWSSEVFNTIRLARKGVLEEYESPGGVDIPDRFKDPKHRWYGTAARARVLAYDPIKTPSADVPKRWADVFAEASRPTAIANPLFGTTRGHVAAMFALWGKDKGREYLTRLRDGGIEVVAGNSAGVRWVGTRRVDLAFTDSDDCFMGRARGMENLDFVFPDMGDGGTLLIPCTTAIIKGAPNPTGARKLLDFLISDEVEALLHQSPAGHWPVRENVRAAMRVDWPPESHVSYDKVVDAMDDADAAVREILIK